MKQYWENLQAREQQMVIIGTVAAMLLLVYALVWSPYQYYRDSLSERVVAQQETLAWMQKAAAEVSRLRGSAPKSRPANRSLLTVTDRSARLHGLSKSLQRIQPEDQTTVRVWLEGAVFDDVMRWLNTLLNRHSVSVSSVVIEEGQRPGYVNARIVLKG